MENNRRTPKENSYEDNLEGEVEVEVVIEPERVLKLLDEIIRRGLNLNEQNTTYLYMFIGDYAGNCLI